MSDEIQSPQEIKSDQATLYTLDNAVEAEREAAPSAPNDGKRKM